MGRAGKNWLRTGFACVLLLVAEVVHADFTTVAVPWAEFTGSRDYTFGGTPIRDYEESKGIGGTEMAKVVMTTAVTDAKSIMESLIKGSCEAYLTKPLDRMKLENVMSELGFEKK